MAKHLSHDQISFYDESLKKQIEGAYRSDGRAIHVRSVHGARTVPYSQADAHIDGEALDLMAQKVLSELARDPSSGQFTDLQKQTGDQVQPKESFGSWALFGH